MQIFLALSGIGPLSIDWGQHIEKMNGSCLARWVSFKQYYVK